MPNNASINRTITTQSGSITIPKGYHSGNGKVTASFSNLVPENIKLGINIGGIVGRLMSEDFQIKIVNSEKNIIYEFTTKGGNGGSFGEYDIPKSVIPSNAQYIEAINKMINSSNVTVTNSDYFAKFNINTGEIIKGKNHHFDKVEFYSDIIKIRLYNTKSITLMIS